MKKTASILLLSFSTFAFSQSVTGEDELYKDYEKADAKLNSVYNQLKKGLDPQEKKALTEAQKAWIKFRDLNCQFKSGDNGTGSGPYENKLKLDCLIQTTIERTKELKDLIDEL